MTSSESASTADGARGLPGRGSAAGFVRGERRLTARGRKFRVLSMSPPATRGTLLVFPGRNGVPEEVAGLAAPDFPGRAVALALARAGWKALVPDYCPCGPASGSRSERMLAAQVAFAAEECSLGLALVELAASLAPGVDGMFGHSVGAFLAAAASAMSGSPVPLVLASGVAPTPLSDGTPGTEFYDLRGTLPAHFEDLLVRSRAEAIQIQIGLRDKLIPAAAQFATAEAVAAARDGVEILCFDMGHDTDHAAAIAHFETAR